MDIGQAVSFIFDDRKWVNKLVVLAVVTFVAMIPFIGLPAMALALGFMLELARNVSHGLPRPLPDWKNLEQKLSVGGQVLIAMIVYNLPLLVVNACTWTLAGSLGTGLLGNGAEFFALCCVLPFTILYLIFAWPVLAVGVSDFLNTGKAGALYRIGHLWDAVWSNSPVMTRWVLYGVLVNLLLTLMMMIPCIGWLVVALFAFPVHGHLFGQLAHQLNLTGAARPRQR